MPLRPLIHTLALVLTTVGLLLAHQAQAQAQAPRAPAAPASAGQQDFSPAERLIFMNRQLGRVTPPAALRYSYQQSGTLEPGFTDQVQLQLRPQPDGGCCATHTDYLSAARQISLPDLPEADANPVILHFLEREVREMHRRTKGSEMHFRKRLRMAIYQAATVQPQTVVYQGRSVAAQAVTLNPFLDDPNRPRYPGLALKRYRFILSDAVPGALVSIDTLVEGASAGAPALLREALLLEGALAVPMAPAQP